LHHFPFSPRPGAAAAAMPRVSKKTITVRVSELKDFSEQILHKKLSEYIGKETVVLAEKTKIAKTNSFLQVQSNEPLEVGKEYIFYCESCDKKYIIGNPVMAIS
jgi:threonylcarbamoyladenosine tRNA methylthiotransferase MtaB